MLQLHNAPFSIIAALLFGLMATVLLPMVQASLTADPSSFEALCSSFAGTANSTAQPTFITNITYEPANSVNISTATNSKPFCRVYAKTPYPNSNFVSFELWLPPPTTYNQRFTAVGNGGMAGTIDHPALLGLLNQGFAAVGGDSGHLAADNNNGNGKPGVYLPYLHNYGQTSAWIHDSIALMTPPAKRLVDKFYGKPPKAKYFQGCSTGGAQGFALAQLHPTLFDGIVAGSPGNWYSHLALSFLWNSIRSQSSSFLSQPALNLITSAVLKKCDSIDGVTDGVLENPLQCDFDIASLACDSAAEARSSCLTQQQIAQAKKTYQGPRNTLTDQSLYPGFSHGSEKTWLMQESSLANAFSIPILQNLVFDNLTYDASTFDWGNDVATVDQKAGTLIDQVSNDMSTFRDVGAKMVVTQGWADPYNAAIWPIQHLEQFQKTMGGAAAVAKWFSLFMVPGGGHCGSAPGYSQVPAKWHALDVLIDWVENGHTPKQMLSTGPADGSSRTRKLCPWPQTAAYVQGDKDSWSSYVCK